MITVTKNSTKMEISQAEADGNIIVSINEHSNILISPDDMFMLIRLYKSTKENDIYNYFINPSGVSRE